ncbi:hypothetical protein SAMN06265222_1541 [Neorhodopirellula lusitana]|uniref:Uncharacterized protein n=1 Tax=Neorhodopirellula lusitana TaxID=445327 RepID=A0ABY1QXB1_9BACT|nr:hypothetical protein [Neorhodopirellula lusitana]SMP80461.1 hypothetical protein SAMN06265222_1541 [Neorhodopirellula lusitana]
MAFKPNDIKRIARPKWTREFIVDVEIPQERFREIQSARADLESAVHESVVDYLTEPDICFDDDNFPSTRQMNGEYYLGDEWYVHHADTDVYHCSVMARCLAVSAGERPLDDYLGLEVHLRWVPGNGSFDKSWGSVDSSAI